MTVKKIFGTPEQLQARRVWVNALRSGEYTQTNGRLQDANGMCCLGVACDVSGLGQWLPPQDDTGIQAFKAVGAEYPEEHMLPRAVAVQLGMKASGRFVESGMLAEEGRAELWELNDYDNLSFSQIADVIEKYFDVAPE